MRGTKILLLIMSLTLSLFAQFQIWGVTDGTVNSDHIAVFDSLGINYIFAPSAIDTGLAEDSTVFPARRDTVGGKTDLSLLETSMRLFTQQKYCNDFGDSLETGNELGNPLLRVAAAHYENWEAEGDELPSEWESEWGLGQDEFFRTWLHTSHTTTVETTGISGNGYVSCNGDTGVVIVTPVLYENGDTNYYNFDDTPQYGYYKQNDEGQQQWEKYSVEIGSDSTPVDVPVVPYTLSIIARASALPDTGDSPPSEVPVLAFGVFFFKMNGVDTADMANREFYYKMDTLTVADLNTPGFNRYSLKYDWRDLWKEIYTGTDTTVYKRYHYYQYRVILLDTSNTAEIDIDRIVCWDEPNMDIYPEIKNGIGKILFEPEGAETLDTKSYWDWVQLQLSPFDGDSRIYGFRGETEQSRLPNQWAAAMMLSDTLANHGFSSDYLAASSTKGLAPSYIYYVRPSMNRRTSQRIASHDYTGIDAGGDSTFQRAMQECIEEYDEWRLSCSISDSVSVSQVQSNSCWPAKDYGRVVYHQELMLQVYLALAHGIKNISFYPIIGTDDYPDSACLIGMNEPDSNCLSPLGRDVKNLIEELEAIGPILYELDFDTAFCAICGGDTVGEVGKTILDIPSLVLDSLIGYVKSGDTITSSIYDTNCIEVAFFVPPGDTVGYFMVVNRMANDTDSTGVSQANIQFVRLFFTDTTGTSYTFVRHGTWRSSCIWEPQEPAYDGTFDLLVPLAGGEGALISVHVAQDSYISYLEEGANLLSTPMGELCGVPVLSYFSFKSDSSTKVIEPDSVRRLVWVVPESTGVDSLFFDSSKPYEITNHQNVYQVFTDTSYSITRAGKGDTLVECSHTTGPFKTFPHSSVVAGGFYGVQHSGNYSVTGDSTFCVLMSTKPAIAHAFNPYGYTFVANCCIRAGSGYWGITTHSLRDEDSLTYTFPDSIEEGCRFRLDFVTAIFPAILYEFVTPPRDSGTIWSKQLELDINWDGDSITATDTDGNGLGGCLIAIQVGDSIKFVNTDTTANDAGIAACSRYR